MIPPYGTCTKCGLGVQQGVAHTCPTQTIQSATTSPTTQAMVEKNTQLKIVLAKCIGAFSVIMIAVDEEIDKDGLLNLITQAEELLK